MNAAIFAFSRQGQQTARRIDEIMRRDHNQVALFTPAKFADADFAGYTGGLSEFVGGLFDRDALIFVGACGIAVRAIASHVKDKRHDPAVLCADERAQYVIPILSGHIGGANALAQMLADALKAQAIITTATDVNDRFSVDTWATEHGLFIANMAMAKRISAEILERDIPICGDVPISGTLPSGLQRNEIGALGICVSVRDASPFEQTLLLVPRVLRLGIGCRRGTPEDKIKAAVDSALKDNNLRAEAVREVASIDVKSDEAGLLAYCRARHWPIRFYSAQQLNAVPGSFSGSEFVRQTVGVDNVCERAALVAGGSLIVPKAAKDGVTVAIAEMEWGIEFGKDSSGGHRPR